MNIEEALKKLDIVEDDSYLQNFIAQANARYILLNTSENRDNFPAYTIKDDRLGILAFYYLNLGCILAENQNFDQAKEPLEKGASILEYIHGSVSNRTPSSNYYGLISALSYYAGFHYSKSFIIINKFEHTTFLSKLLFSFLKRDFNQLTIEINKIIVDVTYRDNFISENLSEIDGDNKIYDITIARSLNAFLQYFYSGNDSFLIEAKTNLQNLKEVAELKSDPGIWWVLRLLLIISEGFKEAALWQVLKNFFDINDEKVKKYIQSLVFSMPRGIYELFITQRKSLPKVLNAQNKGSVVSMPTSSGKTRIAEIAILDSLLKNTESKVLYIAPFRSLAYEIENSLDKVLENSEYIVSHLYGGGLFSKLDEKIIEESNVIIATPEKAKAMLRSNNEILNSIKLIVIDEGHLFGAEKRHIVNEIFYEELRFFINKNNGKFILLSALLPNADEMATWLTDSTENAYKDTWRPSDERFGILEWTGSAVNLNWKSGDTERATFNNNFILSEQLPLKDRQIKMRFFPSNKNEAVAATAHKLRVFGPALIFVGLKASVFVMAEAYLKCLGNAPEDFSWKNPYDWKAFELACKEIYGDNNNWLLYARKGILCHNADLHSDVRLPLERLMRSDRPLVIIATSTLGQGVNLGISSIIFSTLYQGGELIKLKDFWNIAGRAGRAFIDHEGKILVALDISQNTTRREKLNIRSTRRTIDDYFNKSKITPAISGILILLRELKKFALGQNISFDLLIQLISENKTQEIGEEANKVEEYLDWIDDSLLALHSANHETSNLIDYTWVEEFFRKSLACIQAANETEINSEEVIQLIKSRIKGILLKVGTDEDKWQSIIKSGIPLNSSLYIEERLPLIIEALGQYLISEKDFENKIHLLKTIEEIIIDIPIFRQEGLQINTEDLEIIRDIWFRGKPLSDLNDDKNAIAIVNKFYTFILPWLLNAIAKKLTNIQLENEADILEELSVLVELGLPNIKSVKIYQAGIRSRSVAQEISNLFEELWADRTIKEFKNELLKYKEKYKQGVSDLASEWIELFSIMARDRKFYIEPIKSFNFPDGRKPSEILIAREINGKQYLLSPDLKYAEDISGSKINFESVNKVNGIYFKFNPDNNGWEMQIDNPYIKFNI